MSSAQADDVAIGEQLLASWRASLQEKSAKDSMVGRIITKGLAETEALLEKVKQAGAMRQQIEGLPAGTVKDHMGKALAQLEAELAATVGQETTTTAAAAEKGTPTPPVLPAPTPSAATSGDATYTLLAERLAQAGGGVQVKGNKDALALAVHVVLLAEGFVCYAKEEEKGGPTGFAPPVRAVTPSRLVPATWNADPANVCLTYRHDRLRGRDLKLKVLWMDEERAVVELQDGTSKGGAMTLQGSDFVVAHSGKATTTNTTDPLAFVRHQKLDALRASIRTGLVQTVLPVHTSTTSSSGQGSILPTPPAPSAPDAPPFRGQHPFEIPVPNPLGPMVPPSYGGFGSRGGGLVPDFDGDLQPGGGWGGPGGGNLMGPNHPAFTGECRGGFGGGGPGQPGLGMPRPRFDPYGPLIPPGRGGPPARGPFDPNDPRGRGQAFREPQPDHLPPPGGPGNMYF